MKENGTFIKFVFLIVVFSWLHAFAYAQNPASEQSVNSKLLEIEQVLTRIREAQKQIAEKQAQTKEELSSLRIIINRFRGGA